MKVGDVVILVDQVRKRKEKEEEHRKNNNKNHSNIKNPYMETKLKTIQKDHQNNISDLSLEDLADLDDQLNDI